MRFKFLVAISMFFAFSIQGVAEELRAHIKYVSASSIYLDKGRSDGLQVGDKVSVIRGSETIGTLEIIYISSTSSSCKIITSSADFHVEDEVIVEISPAPETRTLKPIQEDSLIIQRDTSAIVAVPTKPKYGDVVEKLSGRASVQVYQQSEKDGNNYTEPSLYVQTKAENISKSGIDLNIRFRARQRELSSGGTEWNNRFYEISLRRNIDGSKLHWGLGRLTFSRAPGIGFLDGGVFEYVVSPAWIAGGFLGSDPALGGGNPQWDRLKGGGFVQYQSDDYSSVRRFSSTAAIAGTYQKGIPNREFIYLDNDLSLTRQLTFYQSCEVEINRDWRKQVEGSTLKLSSFMLSGRWRIIKGLSLSAGYDDRTPYRDYESRSTPDSLFDESLRQGFRAGLSTQLPFGSRISLDGNAGATKGQKTSRSSSIVYYQPNFFKSGVNSSIRYSIFTSAYSEGSQPSISLTRDLTRDFGLSVQAGRNTYTFKGSNQGKSTSQWGRVGLDYSYGRRLYGSASFELQKAGDFNTQRIYIDIGARL